MNLTNTFKRQGDQGDVILFDQDELFIKFSLRFYTESLSQSGYQFHDNLR